MKKYLRIQVFVFIIALTIFNITSCSDNNNYTSDNRHTYENFEYIVSDNSITLTKYKGNEKNVVIPNEIDGVLVEEIGELCFYQNNDLEIVKFPETVTSINDCAFYRCYNIKEIQLPNNLKEIIKNPFYRCEKLEKFEIDNEYFTTIDGVLYNKDKTILLIYPEGKTTKTLKIPNTVKEIADSAFGYSCDYLKEIRIPKSVKVMYYDDIWSKNDITLYIEKSSYAEDFMKSNNYQYSYY